MKRRGLKTVLTGLVLTLSVGLLAGCGGENTQAESKTLTMSGSSALLPLMEQTSEKFKEKYPNITVNAQAGGSGTGLTQVLEGSVNIGNSDIFAEDKLSAEQAKELVDHKVVAQGFGVVVNKSLGVNNLTKEQIQGIFSGKYTNWKQVGGPDKQIFVIHRPASSGTRGTFTKTLLDGNKSLENDSIGATQDSNGAVLNAMKQNDGAISYLALSYLSTDEAKQNLAPLSVDGVAASKENITTGKYPFWSWGHMYTKGEPTPEAKQYIDFVMSADNKASLDSLGFISGSEMKVK
ncbi:MAG: phosphate ABC transporter substrate-binding protein [Clostridium sp.]